MRSPRDKCLFRELAAHCPVLLQGPCDGLLRFSGCGAQRPRADVLSYRAGLQKKPHGKCMSAPSLTGDPVLAETGSLQNAAARPCSLLSPHFLFPHL